MRVCTCATCVAIAATLTLPLADHRGHDPHAHNPSPAEQVATIGSATVASSSTSSALSARVVHRSWTTTPEGPHVFRRR